MTGVCGGRRDVDQVGDAGKIKIDFEFAHFG